MTPWFDSAFLVGGAAGVLGLAHAAPFPFLLDRLSPAPSVWQMPSSGGRPCVYLTFDDGPNPAATPSLLDLLAAEHARATFFVIDRHVTPATAPILRRMFEEGHTVGLHSHTRALMAMAPAELAQTLTAAARRIERLAGHRPAPVFRPHGGWRSLSMLVALGKIDYKLIGWSWRLWDWDWYRRPSPDRLVPRLLDHVFPGAIIVIHDGDHAEPRADRRYAVDTVARLVPELRARGFEFGTVEDTGVAG